MIDIGLHHFLPGIFAVSFGILGAFIGMKKSQIDGEFTIEPERFNAGLIVAAGVSLLISWAFADHLLNEDTWFLYARRDGLAACLIGYLLMKNMCKK